MTKSPIILCCETAPQQAQLSVGLAVDFDTVLACRFAQLEKMITENKAAVVVLAWQQPCAELNLLIESVSAKKLPLLVMLEKLNHSNISLLPQDTGYALIPFTTETSFVAWIEHARLARENRQNFERELAMLHEKLEERKYVDRAKGMLMKLHQLDEESAYKALRSAAMNNSTSIGQIARNLISTLEVVG